MSCNSRKTVNKYFNPSIWAWSHIETPGRQRRVKERKESGEIMEEKKPVHVKVYLGVSVRETERQRGAGCIVYAMHE